LALDLIETEDVLLDVWLTVLLLVLLVDLTTLLLDPELELVENVEEEEEEKVELLEVFPPAFNASSDIFL
jgi:hypothetical protein